MAQNTNDVSGWVGWVYFAGILMVVSAIFQGFMGLVALLKNDFYVVTENQLAIYNFTAWGWAQILVAVVMLTAGFSLLHGGTWGRVVGVIAVGLALIENLIFLPAYPIWCIAGLVLSSLILYALVVHGNEA